MKHIKKFSVCLDLKCYNWTIRFFLLSFRMDSLNVNKKIAQPLTIAICLKRRMDVAKNAKVRLQNQINATMKFNQQKMRSIQAKFDNMLFLLKFHFCLFFASYSSNHSFFFSLSFNPTNSNRLYLQRWTICKWCRMVWSRRSLCKF